MVSTISPSTGDRVADQRTNVAGAALDRLCELNVIHQAKHVARTTILEDAWERGQEIAIHSWIYRLDTGYISVLADAIKGPMDSDT